MTPGASKQCSFLPPDHHRLAFCQSNGMDVKQVSGSFSILTITSLSPKALAQSLLTQFSSYRFEVTEDGKKQRTRWEQ